MEGMNLVQVKTQYISHHEVSVDFQEPLVASINCLLLDCMWLTDIINPRRACARGLQYLSCLCVCFPYSGTSRNQAYKQQYQRLQRDTGMKYKKGFFFKTLRSEVMASFTHLE